MARPFDAQERARAERLAKTWGMNEVEMLAPVSVIGTAANMNAAIDNGLERAARLLGMTVPEVRNRATVNGAIEIGRAPGVIQVTFLAPLSRLDAAGLGGYVREQYGL
jgi:formamidase